MRRLLALARRALPRRGLTGPELVAALLAVAVALLAACHRPAPPPSVVDPGPPFGRGRPLVKYYVHVLSTRGVVDGVVVIVKVPQH